VSWLIHSRAGFITRLAIGVLFFLVLAVRDLQKNGCATRRWREYLFLIFCVLVAMAYGAVNDQVSSRISWEYFYYGKDLRGVLGDDTPPDALRLSLQAAKIGMMATWSVGLLLGAALLIADNPRAGKPPLPFRSLVRLLVPILFVTVIFAAVFGALGYSGKLNWIDSDFVEMWRTNLWRPNHFTAAWGEHLGGYLGGLLGGAWAVWRVWRR
jgi:hypothetical protein